MSSSETELLFWRVAVNTFTFLCVYDMIRIVLLKWNTGEVTFRSVLEMLFVYDVLI